MPTTSENGVVWFGLKELIQLPAVEHPISRMDEARIALCEEWIELHLKPTKTIRSTTSAYGYKHDVERWSMTIEPRPWVQVWADTPWIKKGERIYIAEEAFVEAMIRRGYRTKKDNDMLSDEYNSVYFNATLAKRAPRPKR